MKKTILLAMVLALAAGSLVLVSAQDVKLKNESEMFVKTFFIEKVYTHNLGFIVFYRKGTLDLGRAAIPLKWLEEPSSKFAESNLKAPPGAIMGNKLVVYYSETAAVPYMSVYWYKGKFDHVVLYLHRDIRNSSYGKLENPKEADKDFDVTDLSIGRASGKDK